MEELKKIIDLTSLTDEEISRRDISLASLWMVKDKNDNVFGPYETEDLKIYIAKYQYLFEKTKTYNLESEKWHDTFNIKHFQRRQKNQDHSTVHLATNEFYIYLNKQQSGPYTKEEIQTFLNNGQVRPDSPISIDKGENWIKLYEHYAFDRRSQKTNQELPFTPSEEVLQKTTLTKEEILRSKEQDEAIVELAFIGHHQTHPEYEVGINKKEKKFSNQAKVLLASAACLAFLFVYALIQLTSYGPNSQSTVESFTTTEVPTASNVKEQENTSAKESPKTVPQRPVVRARKNTTPTLRRYPSSSTTKRAQNPAARARNNTKNRRNNRALEQENENIDINDPEVQDEISRQLSGEFDLDGEPTDEGEPENLEEEQKNEYYGEDEPIEHSVDDY